MATMTDEKTGPLAGGTLESPRIMRKRRKVLNAPADVSSFPEGETFNEQTPEDADERAAYDERVSEEAKMRRVESISNKTAGMISAAVTAKENSGVETRWREDLTHYYGNERIALQVQGITDAALASKSKSRGDDKNVLTRSSINVNITRPKVNAAFARLSDMILPVDGRNFGIENTPVVQLAANEDPEAMVAGPGGTVMQAKNVALKKTTIAKAAAELMQREIDDNLTECDFNGEGRKMLFQAVCLGTGVIKGPVAAMRTERVWVEQDGEWEMRVEENLVPESRHVDVFNFYPDPACNGNVKLARYIVERDEYNARMLRDLRGQPGFITKNIDLCLSRKPGSIRRNKSETQLVQGSYVPGDMEMYEVYHVTCDLTKGELDDLDVRGVAGWENDYNEAGDVIGKKPKPLPEEERQDPVGACVVMCDGVPIKAYLNPLKSGNHGYQVFTYEPVHGQVFGIGVAYLVRSPQRVLSTAWRMVMDNAALTVGGFIIVDRTCVEPADGDWDLYGGKVFYKTKGFATDGKVEDAFKVFQMDSQLDKLEKIIMLATKFAEDETSLPSLMEGNQGTAPDTVGGMTLLMNSANVVLKVLAKRYDDCITKPHIGGYYDWHMLYNPKSEIKGDFNVLAIGSSHLVVRDLQRQSLIGFMQYAGNPSLAIFFKTGGYMALRKVAEANHITPDDVLCDEESAPGIFDAFQKQMAAAAQAKAGGGGDNGQAEAAKMQADMADRERDREFQLKMKQMDHELKMMEFAEKRDLSLEEVRAQFAMKIMDQRHSEKLQNNETIVKEKTGSGL